jgi:hypothetical protein
MFILIFMRKVATILIVVLHSMALWVAADGGRIHRFHKPAKQNGSPECLKPA